MDFFSQFLAIETIPLLFLIYLLYLEYKESRFSKKAIFILLIVLFSLPFNPFPFASVAVSGFSFIWFWTKKYTFGTLSYIPLSYFSIALIYHLIILAYIWFVLVPGTPKNVDNWGAALSLVAVILYSIVDAFSVIFSIILLKKLRATTTT